MWALYYLCNFTYSCHLPLIIIFNMIDMQRTKESNPNNPIAEIVPLLPYVCVCVCVLLYCLRIQKGAFEFLLNLLQRLPHTLPSHQMKYY